MSNCKEPIYNDFQTLYFLWVCILSQCLFKRLAPREIMNHPLVRLMKWVAHVKIWSIKLYRTQIHGSSTQQGEVNLNFSTPFAQHEEMHLAACLSLSSVCYKLTTFDFRTCCFHFWTASNFLAELDGSAAAQPTHANTFVRTDARGSEGVKIIYVFGCGSTLFLQARGTHDALSAISH